MDDDFLNCDDLPPSIATSSPRSSSSSSIKQVSSPKADLSIEDELDSIFSLSPADKIQTNNSGIDLDTPSSNGNFMSGINMSEVNTSLALNNDDFLAWLAEESPKPSGKSSNKSNDNSSNDSDDNNSGNNSNAVLKAGVGAKFPSLSAPLSISTSQKSHALLSSHSVPSAVSPGSIDSLIDELFEVSGPSSSSASLSSMSCVDSFSSLRDLSSEIHEALNSNFVDSYSLRGLISDAGYIPEQDRCKIWNVLINGLVSEDIESLTFKASDKNIASYNSLSKDCDDLISFYSLFFSEGCRTPSVDFNTLKSDVIDILVLYLMRKGMSYSKILAPFAVVVLYSSHRNSVPRSLASSCFYSFANAYLPLFQLDLSSYDISVDSLHFYTRLLVSYHHPKLALHLDQVFPGWEQSDTTLELPAEGNDSAPILPIPANANANSTHSNNSSNHGSPSRKALCKVGFISNQWLVGCFLSALPLDVGAMLMDWIIFNEERFAGLYLTVALLQIFGDTLLDMDRAAILAWQKEIDSGVIKWKHNSSMSFEIIPSPKHKNKNNAPTLTSMSTGISEVTDLNTFVVGWLFATSALRDKTPSAMKLALNSLDSWSKTVVDRLRRTSSNMDDGSQDRGKKGLLGSGSLSKSTFTAYSIESDGEDELGQGRDADSGLNDAPLSALSVQQNELLKYNGKDGDTDCDTSRDRIDLMMRFKQFSMSFHNESPSFIGGENNSLDSSNSVARNKVFIQDYEREGVSLCLWSDAAEVVPCIASQKKRIGSPKPLMHYFFTGLESAIASGKCKSEAFSYLPSSLNMSSEVPFFFGIDCRTEKEKSLGLFPKSYSLDPSLLTDSDHVQQLLETLEPLSNSVHLCIFGAGASYIQWKLQKEQSDKKLQQVVKAFGSSLQLQQQSQQQDTVESLWREERSKLNSVAMFFMKKSFCHVSILEGGFSAATKHLYNHQSNTPGSGLSASLVEADLRSIYSILGVVDMMPSVKQVGTGVNSNSNSLTSSLSSYTQAASSYIKPFISSSSGDTSASSFDSGSSNGSANTAQNSNNSSSSNSSNTQPTAAKLSSYVSSWAGMTSNFIKSSVSGLSTQSDSNPSSSATPAPQAPGSGGRYSEKLNDIVAPENLEKGKAAIAEVGKRLSIFGSASLESLKKGISQVSEQVSTSISSVDPPLNLNKNSNRQQQSDSNSMAHVRSGYDSNNLDKNSTAFVIDDEEGEDNADARNGPVDSLNTDSKISINKSESEKQQALIIHRLAGLRKGDEVIINREFLPGAVLFPCMKLKEKKQEEKQEKEERGEGDTAPAASIANGPPLDVNNVTENVEVVPAAPNFDLLHRYLVVTKERFMVLDANGGGVGAKAIVKSNHHLTELIKMTFRKKDPELVTVFFVHNGGANKTHQYRVPKKLQFVEVLQKNMQKFKD